jgi:hypothetical protein
VQVDPLQERVVFVLGSDHIGKELLSHDFGQLHRVSPVGLGQRGGPVLWHYSIVGHGFSYRPVIYAMFTLTPICTHDGYKERT